MGDIAQVLLRDAEEKPIPQMYDAAASQLRPLPGTAAGLGVAPITGAATDAAVAAVTAAITALQAVAARDDSVDAVTTAVTALQTVVTAMSGKLPASLGVKADAASLSVALSTEQRAMLSAIQTALEIIDDWDDGNRASVNIVSGQAGITGGAGAVGASTPRVTHASDDPVTTALQIMDDWDESDRAKVNLIVGQAGVTAGAGAVAAGTPRITLASDDPAVAALASVLSAFTGKATDAQVAAIITALNADVGVIGDAEASSGNGTVIAILKNVRTRLAGRLQATLTNGSGVEIGDSVTPVQVTQAALSAADQPGVVQDGQYIQIGSTRYDVLRAFINATSSGNNALIAAHATKKNRLLSLYIHTRNALDIKLQSATTDMSPLLPFAANQKREWQHTPYGHFENALVNQAVNVNLSGAGTVGVSCTYIQV